MVNQAVGIQNARDMRQVSCILANAFATDPIMNWVCPDSGYNDSLYAALFRLDIEALYKKQGMVHTNAEQTGAALWLPPNAALQRSVHWRIIDVLWKMVSHKQMQAMQRGDWLEKFLFSKHPKEPHYYLRALGTTQGQQGKGIGSTLLRHGLKICDDAQMPAYLESSSLSNIPLYKRYGFEVTSAETLPDGGPTIWLMYRKAQTKQHS